MLCYSITVKIATRYLQQSIKSTNGKASSVCVPDRDASLLLVLFPASFDPGSCFCPQDVVEEAVLLLLITESMVRHAYTLFFQRNPLCTEFAVTSGLMFACSVEWRGGHQSSSRPSRSSPGQPTGCHFCLWPALSRHGQEGAVCHAFWGLYPVITHYDYVEVCGRERERWESDKCSPIALPLVKLLMNILLTWARGLWYSLPYPLWIPPSFPLQLHPGITWALVCAACLTDSQKDQSYSKKGGTISYGHLWKIWCRPIRTIQYRWEQYKSLFFITDS